MDSNMQILSVQIRSVFFLVFCGYTALNILCARHYSRLFFLLIAKLICVRADEVCLSVWNHHIKNGKFRIG